ncbi:hypothetical protein UFOVP35_39 [uncultured Caudovirales phage]|uniref:Uncharacterized protein n=1 Tax=uncultured Caudovirales phage TaxID=2100421 RepID=A0A6J7WPK0_9CAUD|nr:hypothetical protein UFOVP35_39 [uncultured Caudovirales phage]CAB4124404.1 hypothetical protein UFOVP52_8 [uncultured Caudovirales phage]CAB5219826.1 hypothetical protein UFOVP234_33 [uncultured Caudovirales phage]
MPKTKNEFDDLFGNVEAPEKKETSTVAETPAAAEAPVAAEEPTSTNELADKELEDMFAAQGGDATYAAPHDYVPAQIGAGLGALSSSKELIHPKASTVSSSRITPLVERLMKVSPGSVAKTYSAMQPLTPTMDEAARLAVQSSMPTAEETKRILGGTTEESTSGRQRAQGFNAETARQAEAEKLNRAKLKVLQSKGLISTGTSPTVNAGPMTVTKGGIFAPAASPAEEAAAQAAQEANATKQAAGLAKEAQKTTVASKLAGPLAAASKLFGRAVTGAGIADTASRLYGGDYSGGAISGLATALPVAAGLATAPAWAMPAALTASGGLAFALWAKDHPEDAKRLMSTMQQPSPAYDYTQSMMGP